MSREAELDAAAEEFTRGMRKYLSMPDLPIHFMRLLAATREPVRLKDLAAAGGWSVGEVEAELRRDLWRGIHWSDDGRLAGFGLTLRETPHKITLGDATFYTHCAGDALGMPMILHVSAVIESSCPATGRPIRVELTPHELVSVDPAETVMSTVPLDGDYTDAIAEVCGNRNLFASAEAAAEWLAAVPQGRVTPIADELEALRRADADLRWSAGTRCDC
jgi:alkylmercury lyase